MIEQKDIEQYIRKNLHQLTHGDWCDICQYYKLSESFMREFANDIEWLYVCQYQKMSEEFMREFPMKLWIMEVFKYQKITPDFVYWLFSLDDLVDQFDEYRASSILNLLKQRNIIFDETKGRFKWKS